MSNFKTSNTTIMNWKSKQKHVFLCLKSSSGYHIAYRIKSKFLSMLFNAFFFFFSSTSLLLPTHLPPPSCTHAQSCNPMDFSPPDSSVHGFSRQEYWSGLPFPSPYLMLFIIYLQPTFLVSSLPSPYSDHQLLLEKAFGPSWSGDCVELELSWRDTPCPRAKEKPQQDGEVTQSCLTLRPQGR